MKWLYSNLVLTSLTISVYYSCYKRISESVSSSKN